MQRLRVALGGLVPSRGALERAGARSRDANGSIFAPRRGSSARRRPCGQCFKVELAKRTSSALNGDTGGIVLRGIKYRDNREPCSRTGRGRYEQSVLVSVARLWRLR